MSSQDQRFKCVQPRRRRYQDGAVAFTLIEVLVVVAIIALLIAVLLPSLTAAREQGKRAACAGQMHHLALGLHSYASEHRGHYPYGLSFPSTPFGPPFSGPFNPQTQFTTPNSGRIFEGYPAYIALYKLKQVPEPKAFYCPAQEVLTYNGRITWPKEPPSISEAKVIGNLAYRNYIIGYSWFADHWMSKDAYDEKAVANFPPGWVDYPDNSWAHHLGRRYGKRQRLADSANDPGHTMILADIMQDMRSYRMVLYTDKAIRGQWGADNWRPQVSYNSHGGRFRFIGGNVAYNDGSITWRPRERCEADFRRSFEANNSYKSWEPNFAHMAVVKSLNPEDPSKEFLYNLYW